MIKEAIILAGGMGTRLRTVVSDVPKPMAPIDGRPFLTYLIDYLQSHGIETIVFSVGYMADIISDYFGTNYKGCTIRYALEQEPLGTGGAIREAIKYTSQSHVVVTNGDSIFLSDLEAQYKQHLSSNATVSLALKPMKDFDRYGTVVMDKTTGRIKRFKEKEARKRGLINGGVYIFDVDQFCKLDLPSKFSIEEDYFKKYIQKNCFIGHVDDGYFLDIGIPEDFIRAQVEFMFMGENR